jgi:hypothetical protein
VTARFRRARHASERRVGNSLFLAHAERGSMFRVNETVGALWKLLAEPVSRAEAVAVFLQAFPDETPERVEDLVDTMMGDLLEEDLIEPADPSDPPEDGR